MKIVLILGTQSASAIISNEEYESQKPTMLNGLVVPIIFPLGIRRGFFCFAE